MNIGFFKPATVLGSPPASLVPKCGICQLYRHCKSPKMTVAGEGRRKIFVIGEAPASKEDRDGLPFVGGAGRYLRGKLAECGIDLDRDCWTTNAIICWPHEAGGNGRERNRTPTDKEIDYCRPNLVRAINELNPEIVIPLGAKAVRSLIGWLWKPEVEGIGRWIGWQIPSQRLNAWIVPNWHPAFLLRQGDNGQRMDDVAEKMFLRHLKAAAKLKGRPWERVPDYRREVEVVMDPKTAAFNVGQMIKHGKPVAFDYETDGLKPDNPGLGIVSCGMSNGEFTFAYPWHGEAIAATKEFLASGMPKVGWNVKYEQRWTRAKLGIGVRNWVWDGMIAAHVLDNRKHICSAEFQEFVLLGFAWHKGRMGSLMKAAGTNSANRLREANLAELLTYNGLDALVEWRMAQAQARRIGMDIPGLTDN